MYGISEAFDRANIGGSMDGTIIREVMDYFAVPARERLTFDETYERFLAEALGDPEQRRILPGIPEILGALEDTGAYNALLTSNLQIGAFTKLRSVGLDGYFAAGGYGDRVFDKYEAALEGLAAAEKLWNRTFHPEEIWVVGDTPYDVNCAKRLGARSLAVTTGWADRETLAAAEPTVLQEDLSNLNKVLEIFLG